MEPLASYATMTAATVTSAAALYVARVARRVVRRVEDADERSRRNSRLLTGETEDGEAVHYDGVLDRLERIEATRQDRERRKGGA